MQIYESVQEREMNLNKNQQQSNDSKNDNNKSSKQETNKNAEGGTKVTHDENGDLLDETDEDDNENE
jgi:hypothetical protein